MSCLLRAFNVVLPHRVAALVSQEGSRDLSEHQRWATQTPNYREEKKIITPTLFFPVNSMLTSSFCQKENMQELHEEAHLSFSPLFFYFVQFE